MENSNKWAVNILFHCPSNELIGNVINKAGNSCIDIYSSNNTISRNEISNCDHGGVYMYDKSSSGADLIGKNVIESDKISLKATSGSDLEVELSADEVSANTSSGADIKLSGEANMLNVKASSGSDIKARDFIVQTCHADASSGADISVNVSENLIADASSGGDISYTGDATVQMKKSVSGSVHKN